MFSPIFLTFGAIFLLFIGIPMAFLVLKGAKWDSVILSKKRRDTDGRVTETTCHFFGRSKFVVLVGYVCMFAAIAILVTQSVSWQKEYTIKPVLRGYQLLHMEEQDENLVVLGKSVTDGKIEKLVLSSRYSLMPILDIPTTDASSNKYFEVIEVEDELIGFDTHTYHN